MTWWIMTYEREEIECLSKYYWNDKIQIGIWILVNWGSNEILYKIGPKDTLGESEGKKNYMC